MKSDKIKNMSNIRFLNLQSSDIYFAMNNNKTLSFKNFNNSFNSKYKEIMPLNLDLLYLISKGKLTVQKIGDEYSSEVFVNVSFKYPLFLNEKGEQVFDKNIAHTTIPTKVIRKYLYLNGFTLNGKEYVRYKRSSGSAKSGSCLFIRKNLFSMMDKWSKAGLSTTSDLCHTDLTSYEAYKALSLSSLITTLDLNPKNILFVKDAEVKLFNQKVIKVSCAENKGLEAAESIETIENNIFDGEGLLDSSVFKNTFLDKGHKKSLSDKGMMLLRGKFFKCCAFNTNLQEWFKDNNITRIDQLYGITFAEKIEDIVLVASESCLKYLKMTKGGFNEKNIKRWCDSINEDENKFGVVKTDKATRFFNGDMVETTYQLLNTLKLSYSQVRSLVLPNYEYISKIRNIKDTPEFIRFFLEGEDYSNSYNCYLDDSEDISNDEIGSEMLNYSSYSFKNKVCLELTRIDENIKYTELFKRRVYRSIVDSLLLKLYNGRVLVHGTYATLFGNPFEFLKYIIKDERGKPLFDVNNPVSLFKEGEFYCSFFENDEKVLGSRAPHTTMGNILISKNKYFEEIQKYFNLTKQIVVVDAVNNNIQHRMSGCDYDSDSVLLTNNKIMVESAEANYETFLVPYASYKPTKKGIEIFEDVDKKTNILLNLFEIDNFIANNNVGKIVNLSQLLNSHLWNDFKDGKNDNYKELYNKIAILSVLSGAEIDSAKRVFPFKTSSEYRRIHKYAKEKDFYDQKPLFFAVVQKEKNKKATITDIKKLIAKPRVFKTTMDYLWEFVNKHGFDLNVRTKLIPFTDLICVDLVTEGVSGDVYRQVNKTIELLEQVSLAIQKISYTKRDVDYELKLLEFNSAISSCYKQIKHHINTPTKIKMIVRDLEKQDDGFSKIFILLYIVSSFSKEIGITLKSLFKEGSKPLPTLRKANEGEEVDHILFDDYNYCIKRIL